MDTGSLTRKHFETPINKFNDIIDQLYFKFTQLLCFVLKASDGTQIERAPNMDTSKEKIEYHINFVDYVFSLDKINTELDSYLSIISPAHVPDTPEKDVMYETLNNTIICIERCICLKYLVMSHKNIINVYRTRSTDNIWAKLMHLTTCKYDFSQYNYTDTGSYSSNFQHNTIDSIITQLYIEFTSILIEYTKQQTGIKPADNDFINIKIAKIAITLNNLYLKLLFYKKEETNIISKKEIDELLVVCNYLNFLISNYKLFVCNSLFETPINSTSLSTFILDKWSTFKVETQLCTSSTNDSLITTYLDNIFSHSSTSLQPQQRSSSNSSHSSTRIIGEDLINLRELIRNITELQKYKRGTLTIDNIPQTERSTSEHSTQNIRDSLAKFNGISIRNISEDNIQLNEAESKELLLMMSEENLSEYNKLTIKYNEMRFNQRAELAAEFARERTIFFNTSLHNFLKINIILIKYRYTDMENFINKLKLIFKFMYSLYNQDMSISDLFEKIKVDSSILHKLFDFKVKKLTTTVLTMQGGKAKSRAKTSKKSKGSKKKGSKKKGSRKKSKKGSKII